MEAQEEISSILATLPDGSSILSVMVDDLPRPRHLYRVMGPDGALVSEHAALLGLADFLTTYDV